MSLPTIYCINLRASTDRQARMIDRFQLLNTKYQFVDAYNSDNPIIDNYIRNSKCWYSQDPANPHPLEIAQWRKDVACFASHIKALQRFIATGEKEALICEDDTLFRKNFIKEYHKVMHQLPIGAPLVTFCYMLGNAIDQTLINGYFWKVDPAVTWSGNLYYITREYALQCIKDLNVPFPTKFEQKKYLHFHESQTNPKVTAEHIIRFSDGYICAVPLAIEDGINSVRAPQDLPYHHRHYCHWGYSNFDDPTNDSPLKHFSVEKAWPGYPFAKVGTKGAYKRMITWNDAIKLIAGVVIIGGLVGYWFI